MKKIMLIISLSLVSLLTQAINKLTYVKNESPYDIVITGASNWDNEIDGKKYWGNPFTINAGTEKNIFNSPLPWHSAGQKMIIQVRDKTYNLEENITFLSERMLKVNEEQLVRPGGWKPGGLTHSFPNEAWQIQQDGTWTLIINPNLSLTLKNNAADAKSDDYFNF